MNDRPLSVIETMATKFGMAPDKFERTLRATVVPQGCTPEQFAAFLLVARQYDLNPVTREIHAFPRPGGGIQPIVGVDGWLKMVNSHPQMDGLEFEDIYDDGGLIAIKCRIYRKDRAHPTEVPEYMAECRRSTEPWKQWPTRMLRHKSLIQCARIAFGFAGILEPDEYERWTSSDDEPVHRRTKKIMAKEFATVAHDEAIQREAALVNEVNAAEAQPDNPMPEFSAADAHELGREHRRQGKALKASPSEWRDGTPEHNAWIEAREDGWREEDKEITEREKAAKKREAE